MTDAELERIAKELVEKGVNYDNTIDYINHHVYEYFLDEAEKSIVQIMVYENTKSADMER